MFHGFWKVAVCSPRISLGDTARNAKEIERIIGEARGKGAKIIVLPKAVFEGASIGSLGLFRAAEIQIKAGIETVLRVTADFAGLLFFGAPIRLCGRTQSGVYCVCRGAILGFVPDNEVDVREAVAFGCDFPVGRDLVFCCEEDASVRVAVSVAGENPYGATCVAIVGNSAEFLASDEERKVRARVLSRQCGYLFAGGNRGESTTNGLYLGATLIAERGEILALSDFDQEMILTEIDFHGIAFCRKNMSASGREVLFHAGKPTLTELTRPVVPNPFHLTDGERTRLLHLLVTALAERIDWMEARHVVLGVSGGQDSTLALLVAVMAMERLERSLSDIVGVSLPCFGTSDMTRENALRLMKELGVTLREIDLNAAVTAHLADIGHDGVHDIAYQNAQARERTQVLMDIANQIGGFVLGTGDFSENALGFCTYNGDHMSMYNINCGLPKTVIGELLEALSKESRFESVAPTVEAVLATPVSPELLPPEDGFGGITQKTEDTVGPYALNDFFLYHLFCNGSEKSKIERLALHAFDGKYADDEIENRLTVFFKRFFASAFKRNCSPDGAFVLDERLTRASFHMPSDMVPQDFLG